MKLLLSIVLLLTVAATLASFSARGATSSKWYWSPAACKAELQNNGVRISDGRTFHVAKAYCVGLHNHCWLNGGQRRYKVFDVVMRSRDGVVRELLLTVTGHHTWSGTHNRVIGQSMSPSRFNSLYGPAAWSVASAENKAGCADAHR